MGSSTTPKPSIVLDVETLNLIAARLTECGIDRNYRKGSKPSDHAPLLVGLSS